MKLHSILAVKAGPGTGKTEMTAAAVEAAAERGLRVLATAPSSAAAVVLYDRLCTLRKRLGSTTMTIGEHCIRT